MRITLHNIDRMTDEELENAITACFEHSPESSQLDRLAILLEAQFYRTEKYKRSDDRTQAERDKIEAKRWKIDQRNEYIIIGMIGVEILLAIGLAIWGDRRQTEDVNRQICALNGINATLVQVQTTSKATADAMDALKTNTEAMTQAIQEQLGLNYEPSLSFDYAYDHQAVSVINNGPTDVAIWGYVLDTFNVRFKEPVLVAARNSNFIDLRGFTGNSYSTIHDKGKRFTMTVFIRMKNEREYIADLQVYVAAYSTDNFKIRVLDSHIKREKWGFRANGDKWR
jgi:hypothetical protein